MEVRAVLARHGLTTVAADPKGDLGRRLASALPELGPVWTAFGRYLAWRVDLLPWADRAPLLELPAGREPLPPETCRRLCAPLRDQLANWEEVPYAVLPLEQRHRARTADGLPGEVRLADPAAADWLNPELEYLGLLAGAFDACEVDAAGFSRVLDEFRQCCRELPAGTARPPQTPTPVAGIAGDGMRTLMIWMAAPGVTIAVGVAETVGDEESPYRRSMRYFRLWRAWFGETWNGGSLPAIVGVDDLAIDDDAPVFLGDSRVDVDAGTVHRLRRYLAAVADGDADGGATALLDEVECAGALPADRGALRRSLRQGGTFRETRWTGVEGLAGELLSHWRILAAGNAPPGRAFTAFFHGTSVIAGLAAAGRGGGVAGSSVAASDALREVRLAGALRDLRNALAPGSLGSLAMGQAAALMELPERLDRVLDRALEGRLRVRLDEDRDRGPSRWARALPVAVGLATVALAGRAAIASGVPGAEPLSLFVLLMFGLWALSDIRSRGGGE